MAPSRATGNLHPYVTPLTVSHLGGCEALENAAFGNPEERASREKVCLNHSGCEHACWVNAGVGWEITWRVLVELLRDESYSEMRLMKY